MWREGVAKHAGVREARAIVLAVNPSHLSRHFVIKFLATTPDTADSRTKSSAGDLCSQISLLCFTKNILILISHKYPIDNLIINWPMEKNHYFVSPSFQEWRAPGQVKNKEVLQLNV